MTSKTPFSIRPIELRDDAAIATIIRAVMPEFGAGGAGFAIHDAEVDAMHAAYARARRAYFVVGNKTSTAYQELKLDLVLFRPDGVIGRRFAVDLGPLKPDKKSVKLFDIEGTACDQVGSFLINDVMECKSDTGPVADCLKDIGVSTLTNVQLNK